MCVYFKQIYQYRIDYRKRGLLTSKTFSSHSYCELFYVKQDVF